MHKFNFSRFSLKSAILLVFCLYLLNTGQAQNVASGIENKLNWKTENTEFGPHLSNFSLANTKINGKSLPSISFNFASKTHSIVTFSNMNFEAFSGFEQFKKANQNLITDNFESSTYFSYEGNEGFVGVNVCPFKFQNGAWYRLTSFQYDITEGPAFSPIQTSAIKRAVTNSVLATGQWIKLSVTTDGFYRLDANWLKNAGIDINMDICDG